MKAVIDKLEGDVAELRIGETLLVVPRQALPAEVTEGDVLTLTFTRDAEATREATEAVEARRKKLLERSKDEPF
jgi:hypothetical protein